MTRETVCIRWGASLHQAQTVDHFLWQQPNLLSTKLIMVTLRRQSFPLRSVTTCYDRDKWHWKQLLIKTTAQLMTTRSWKLQIYVSQWEKVFINVIFSVPNHCSLKGVQNIIKEFWRNANKTLFRFSRPLRRRSYWKPT